MVKRARQEWVYEYDGTVGDGRRHTLPAAGGGDAITLIDGKDAGRRPKERRRHRGGLFLDWLAAMPLYKSIRAVKIYKTFSMLAAARQPIMRWHVLTITWLGQLDYIHR